MILRLANPATMVYSVTTDMNSCEHDVWSSLLPSVSVLRAMVHFDNIPSITLPLSRALSMFVVYGGPFKSIASIIMMYNAFAVSTLTDRATVPFDIRVRSFALSFKLHFGFHLIKSLSHALFSIKSTCPSVLKS